MGAPVEVDQSFYNRGSWLGRSERALRVLWHRPSLNSPQQHTMPHVEEGSFLTLHYRMSGPQGQAIINTFGGQPATLSLGAGELSPAIERRLLGLEEGVHTVIDLDDGEAFGERQPEMVQWVARKLMTQLSDAQQHYVEGDVVQFPTPDGRGQYAGTVIEVREDGAILFDFNHPLAGQPVSFEVQIIGVL